MRLSSVKRLTPPARAVTITPNARTPPRHPGSDRGGFKTEKHTHTQTTVFTRAQPPEQERKPAAVDEQSLFVFLGTVKRLWCGFKDGLFAGRETDAGPSGVALRRRAVS